MRIILLTAFFVAGFYYFRSEEKPLETEITQTTSKDAVQILASAPNRVKRTLAQNTNVSTYEASPREISEEVAPAAPKREVSAISESADAVEEFPWSELDREWNNELKEYLSRLEPYEGENIHKAYLSEIDSFKAEMEALLNEKQSKTTEAEAQEVEQLINQLDYKHEENLKEIFGAHYDAVRDHYNYFMENSSLQSE